MLQPYLKSLRSAALLSCGALFFAACGGSGGVSTQPQGAAEVQAPDDIESCVSTLVDKGAPDALSRELCTPAAQQGAAEVQAPDDFESCVGALVDKGAPDALSRELCAPAAQQGAAEALPSAAGGVSKGRPPIGCIQCYYPAYVCGRYMCRWMCLPNRRCNYPKM